MCEGSAACTGNKLVAQRGRELHAWLTATCFNDQQARAMSGWRRGCSMPGAGAQPTCLRGSTAVHHFCPAPFQAWQGKHQGLSAALLLPMLSVLQHGFQLGPLSLRAISQLTSLPHFCASQLRALLEAWLRGEQCGSAPSSVMLCDALPYSPPGGGKKHPVSVGCVLSAPLLWCRDLGVREVALLCTFLCTCTG